MKVEELNLNFSWDDVKEAALTTIGKNSKFPPDDTWKRRLLRSEHSPIRLIQVSWVWRDLPYYVSVHFTRHKVGIEHFVSTQRSDRTGIGRESLPQNALVSHRCVANMQALVNISRRRLCSKSSLETRAAWHAVVGAIKDADPILGEYLVRECVYRGFCPEFETCGYCERDAFKEELRLYRTIKCGK